MSRTMNRYLISMMAHQHHPHSSTSGQEMQGNKAILKDGIDDLKEGLQEAIDYEKGQGPELLLLYCDSSPLFHPLRSYIL